VDDIGYVTGYAMTLPSLSKRLVLCSLLCSSLCSSLFLHVSFVNSLFHCAQGVKLWTQGVDRVDWVLTLACTQRVKHLMREYKHMVQDPQMLKPLLARLTQHQVSLNPKP
jgi:hypothetical protein